MLKDPLGELRRSIRQIEDTVISQISAVVLQARPKLLEANARRDLSWSMELDSHPFADDRMYVVMFGRFEIPAPLSEAMAYRAGTFGSSPAEFWTMPGFYPGLYYAGGLSEPSRPDTAGTPTN
jgi:hypothetical protein